MLECGLPYSLVAKELSAKRRALSIHLGKGHMDMQLTDFKALGVAFFYSSDIIICHALGPSLSLSPFQSEAASQAPALKGPGCFA